MPVQPTYPGVYIEEVPSGARTIAGVATSITAFVGYTTRGIDNRAKRLFSFSDFERSFGGLASESELSYAVQHFFANGGTESWVVRVPKDDAKAASITLLDGVTGAKKALGVTALSKGAWANNVVIDIDYDKIPNSDTESFNLTVTDIKTGNSEKFPRVSLNKAKSNFAEAVINDLVNGSEMIKVEVVDSTAKRPVQTGTIGSTITLKDIDSKKDYSVKIASDAPASIAPVKVKVIEKGDSIPTSILGVCRLLENRINVALQKELPGARIRCVPNNTEDGIRILSDFAPQLGATDASITFSDGTTDSALEMLALDKAKANVGHYWLGKGKTKLAQADPVEGRDGKTLPKTAGLIGKESNFTGIYALDKVDTFNILCIPDATRAETGNPETLDSKNVDPNEIFTAAMQFCKKRRAFLIIDPPPNVNDIQSASDWMYTGLKVRDLNGAAYFPRLRLSDPLNEFKQRTFAPCGVVAGLYARTDASRGVWKAPAGIEATLNGVRSPVYTLTDGEHGALNPLGLNCFRNFPVYGNVAWGARTLMGADVQASEWKYIPVRRLALYMEESLYRGLKWVVFEPNDEPLWAQIRLNVGAFMHNLFRQGAFQGQTPDKAYFVKCDSETTTQSDINLGIVNILVGFAPLKPAEFVILRLQQIAGQVQT